MGGGVEADPRLGVLPGPGLEAVPRLSREDVSESGVPAIEPTRQRGRPTGAVVQEGNTQEFRDF